MPNMDNFTKPHFLIKILEFILGIICIGLLAGHFVPVNDSSKIEVIHTSFFGFFMVTGIVVISYILDSPIKGVLMMVISFCGGIMYITAGALCIESYDKLKAHKNILGAGITGLITGIVYLCDTFLSWKGT